jgi:hypothetical protein
LPRQHTARKRSLAKSHHQSASPRIWLPSQIFEINKAAQKTNLAGVIWEDLKSSSDDMTQVLTLILPALPPVNVIALTTPEIIQSRR